MRLLTRLHDLQERHGWLRAEDLRDLAAESRVPLYHIQGLISFYPHFRTAPPPAIEVSVCHDMSCHLRGGASLCEVIRERWGCESGIAVREVSCLGRCDRAPAAMVHGVATSADQVRAASREELAGLQDESTNDNCTACWRFDPCSTPEEHYGLLRELLSKEPGTAADRVLTELKASGLRGLGGAAFPTGAKWELVRNQRRSPKYVICNADESEPGTFKDREILRRAAHLVLEGMLTAGLTVGARQGILYIRHEYEPERRAFERVLAEAAGQGLVGKNILDSGFDFEIEVFVSPGGYILGEETALLEALEDKRGEPRNKPPFPAIHGLFGQPTVINNVETLAMVPAIVRLGADWWTRQGRPGFAGLKLLAVSGHVERPGVYEIPTGTTIRELIDLAGGVLGGRRLQAFAPGGASSPMLPASMADTPIDFTTLAQAGSMLGSGALVVVAEGTDMVELAANVVRFFRNESCGKCVPCRVGSQRAVELLERHLTGQSSLDVAQLEQLGETLSLTSICGLGQVALNPILSVLRHWPEQAAPRVRPEGLS